MKRLYVLIAALLVALTPARAQDDQYVHIFTLIQEADTLSNSAQPKQALPKYLEAQTALARFQKAYPEWNAAIVTFRLSYVSAKIEELRGSSAGKAPEGTPTPGVTAGARSGPSAADLEQQIRILQTDLRQLQGEKQNLEAKLKEALGVRPANLDPATLARADEKIRLLQKENDLLKVRLAQETAKPGGQPLAEAEPGPAELSRKLNEQIEKTKTLELEKKALQTRLETLIPSGWNAAKIEETRKALADLTRQVAEQKELNAQLTKERDDLKAQVKLLAADASAAANLRKENKDLQAQVENLKRSAGPTTLLEDKPRQLAEAEAHIAALQSDKEILRLEKIALENRLKTLQGSSAPAPAAAPSPALSKQEIRQMDRLQHERDDLQRKLEAANKQLAARKSKGHVKELEDEVASLRSRLELVEAKPVPYTAEELALFTKPEARPIETSGGKAAVKALPAGTAALVAEANRYFSQRQFDQAETKYLQVLERDKKNPLTLANLAAVQLEMDHWDQAEKHIQQALAQTPNDAYAYSLLGQLRFRQKQYDASLDALSRAAKLDPENAEIQNYLGLILSEKGLRKPAEAALRKAIQLRPNYAAAHNNLAVVYLTQQPPLTELARWHYQRALAAGGEKNERLEQMLQANSR